MRRLHIDEHISPKVATERYLKKVRPEATKRVWYGGRHKGWKLPDPVRLPTGKLAISKVALEKWVLRYIPGCRYTEL